MRSSIVKTDHLAEEHHQPCHFSWSDNEEVISHLVMGIIWKMFDLASFEHQKWKRWLFLVVVGSAMFAFTSHILYPILSFQQFCFEILEFWHGNVCFLNTWINSEVVSIRCFLGWFIIYNRGCSSDGRALA